jgi:hypothetical protein
LSFLTKVQSVSHAGSSAPFSICIGIVSVLLANGAVAAPVPFAPSQENLVVFRGGTVFDGTGPSARADMDVVVDG